jgi:thioredoxin reductase (NADPH)
MKAEYDLIIIGGGPGGLTAGIYAMRAALHTILIEKGIAGGQLNNTDIVENWPGTESITGTDLAAAMSGHAAAYGLETLAREVVEIEPGLDFHRLKLDNGEELRSYAIILGMGGSPRKLEVPGEMEAYGKGVSYCAVCDGFFFRDKTVVVVGGGDTALEEALYLSKITRKVTIIHRRDEFRAGRILQKRVLADTKIEVLWDAVVSEIITDAGGVAGVTTRDTQTDEEQKLEAEGVFIFIGFEPNNALVPAGIRMNADGNVVIDRKCETSTPGIFAIGDLSEKYVRQIVTAAADGCVAAQAAAHYVEGKKG